MWCLVVIEAIWCAFGGVCFTYYWIICAAFFNLLKDGREGQSVTICRCVHVLRAGWGRLPFLLVSVALSQVIRQLEGRGLKSFVSSIMPNNFHKNFFLGVSKCSKQIAPREPEVAGVMDCLQKSWELEDLVILPWHQVDGLSTWPGILMRSIRPWSGVTEIPTFK